MHRNTRPRSMDGGRGVECVAGIFDQSVTRSDVPSFAPSAAWIATWRTGGARQSGQRVRKSGLKRAGRSGTVEPVPYSSR